MSRTYRADDRYSAAESIRRRAEDQAEQAAIQPLTRPTRSRQDTHQGSTAPQAIRLSIGGQVQTLKLGSW